MATKIRIQIDGLTQALSVQYASVGQQLNAHGQLYATFYAAEQAEGVLGQLRLAALLGRGVAAHAVEDDGTETLLFEGRIANAAMGASNGSDARRGEVTAYTASYFLGRRREWRSFVDIDVREAMQAVVADIEFGVHVSSRRYDHVLQHGESDFDFLLRLADREGWFVCTHGPRVQVAGGFDEGPQIAVSLDHDLVEYEIESNLVPTAHTAVFHDIAAHTIEVITEAAPVPAVLSSPGAVAEAAHEASTTLAAWLPDLQRHGADDAGGLASAICNEQRRSNAQALIGRGTSRHAGLQPGARLAIEGSEQLDGACAVVAVQHVYDPASDGYTNTFETTYADTFYLAPHLPRARHEGLTTGVVVENVDPDGMGRLRIALGWQGGERTAWARRASLLGGPERGLYLTPEVGEEVLVAFTDGDLEQPVVVGALWNGRDPVDPDSRDQDNAVKSLVTRSGHRVRLFDSADTERIEIRTPEDRCVVVLTNEGGAGIEVRTDGRVQIVADHGAIEVIANASDIAVLAKKGTVGITADEGEIEVVAKKGDVRVDAEQGAMTLHSKGNLKLLSDDSVLIDAPNGNITINAASIDLKGSDEVSIDTDNHSVSAGSAIQIKSGGSLDTEASQKLTLKGATVEMNS